MTGARGMVGTAIFKTLSGHELLMPEKYNLNVGNVEQVKKFAVGDLDFIIHLAAETDHEYCEANPAQCYFINTVGSGNMTDLARYLDIPIIYISTASIFDGEKQAPYMPNDAPNPINHYNRSKWYGEILVSRWPRNFILRAGWMFGGGPGVDKKFVNKIIAKIDSGAKTIMVCDDCIGSPTYSGDLAKIVDGIFHGDYFFGTRHCVNNCGDGVSRYDFAKEIVAALGKEKDVEIIPCKIDDLKKEFPCPRTNYEALGNSFVKDMPDWRESLKEYINAHYRN